MHCVPMDDDRIEEHTHRSRMHCHDSQNDTVWTQPLLETTAKRHKPSDEQPSRCPSPVLPDELIHEILLRLPVRSLLQFRCVCKSWKTLISDPQFAKDHLRSSISDTSMTHQRLVSSTITERCRILSCSVQSLIEHPSTPAKTLSFRMRRKYHILGSCNGLLCLYDIYQGYVRLWNPSTRLKSQRSPTCVWLDGIISYHGFGYDKVNDKYKVIVAVEDFCETVTKVYTFGENSWKTIQNFPCNPTRWSGKFVGGTLNWVAKGAVNSDLWVILSFDLEKETYAEMLLPEPDDNVSNPVLDVLRNCLCVCFDTNKTHWAVWLMKKYGVQDSWTKLMIIPQDNFRISVWSSSFDPLCISENGIVLAKAMSSKLVLYNSKNGRLLDYPRIWRKFGLDLHIYHESLVSPCY
ncbi:F-box-like domain superfamily [Sesbania bispinosa]|nr:F-box-like domain superfamily [Sesbania bispinosa]